MISKLLTKIYGSRNDRIIQRMKKMINEINQIEPLIEKLNDKQLANKTIEFRKYISQGVSINSLLPKAFAVVREASKRVFGMRLFDVQLIGGIVLNNCSIAEMRTGEGKTLTAVLPAYLNALNSKGVHIVTVNDYLAQRDANNNRLLFEFLGLSVGINLPDLSLSKKRAAYAADITYGTNNEYAFDYLRDNMVFSPEERVQRKLHYALIDEVDSILIDEARNPLIISGLSEDRSDLYRYINKLIPCLIRQDKEDSENYQGNGHFFVDEKSRQVHLTESGLVLIEELLIKANIIKKNESLYLPANIMLMQHITAALRAHVLFTCNVDYIVKNDKIIIVDEHTGRTMIGRRWSDGLHQAIEAKENVTIQNENQILASITFQNYFRLYEKLSGMTGTADTEAFEFRSIYDLDTIVVPTNCPMIRKDLSDLVYITEKEKIKAIIHDIQSCTKHGQPVLVGTTSIEKSELISSELKKVGIMHKVLNAKFHAMEAEIISQAGKVGSVTIATNMAGRGTDIMLGGNWQTEVKALKTMNQDKIIAIKNAWKTCHEKVRAIGGLHVIGTERHESRRIDNQLRGRSGRQGDPGSSRFYLSMEDPLIRIFASNRVSNMMRKLGMEHGEAIEHSLVTKAIANAQCKVENRNFEIRKQLLEYDDVINFQRCAIYAQRNEILDVANISLTIEKIREDVLKAMLERYMSFQLLEESWDIPTLEQLLKDDFNLEISIINWLKKDPNLEEKTVYYDILDKLIIQYQKKESIVGKYVIQNFEKKIMLQTLDSFWKEHLMAMDYLRQGIHLRCYAQKDPKQEYKREAFIMFTDMLESLKYELISVLSKVQICNLQESKIIDQKEQFKQKENIDNIMRNSLKHDITPQLENSKIRRNSFCICGSGKKFKRCHGKLQ